MAFNFIKKTTGILAQTQDKINRQFLKRIDALDSVVGTLKSTVGGSDAGLVKDVTDIKTEIGSETTEGSILKRIKDLEDAP